MSRGNWENLKHMGQVQDFNRVTKTKPQTTSAIRSVPLPSEIGGDTWFTLRIVSRERLREELRYVHTLFAGDFDALYRLRTLGSAGMTRTFRRLVNSTSIRRPQEMAR